MSFHPHFSDFNNFSKKLDEDKKKYFRFCYEGKNVIKEKYRYF